MDEEEIFESDSEFNPSRLGTKEYWEEIFSRDLQLFVETKNVGEIWFGNDSMERIFKWMSKSNLITFDSTILDIGCGNGVMLVELAKLGYRMLYGVDYIKTAIELAESIALTEGVKVQYQVSDIIEVGSDDDPEDSFLRRQYDICLDKGTFDAISLNPVDPKSQTKKYLDRVKKICKPKSGFLVVTSCNWTKEELMDRFGNDFDLHAVIPSPTFSFGGVTGNRETVLVLSRKSS